MWGPFTIVYHAGEVSWLKESMMNAPKNHRQSEARLANQDTGREEQEMSAPVTPGKSKLNGAFQEIKTTLEEIEMKLAVDINNLRTILSKGLVAKALGGVERKIRGRRPISGEGRRN